MLLRTPSFDWKRKTAVEYLENLLVDLIAGREPSRRYVGKGLGYAYWSETMQRIEAIWVHVDPDTRLPARLPEEFESIYGPSAAGRKARAALRHPPEPPAEAERLEWWFGNSSIDLAGHVSNLWYWQPAEEFLDLPNAPAPDEAPAPVVLEAEFRSGIGHGLAAVHRAGRILWISAAAGTVAGTVAVADG